MKKELWIQDVQEEVKERQEKEDKKKARVSFIVSAVKELLSYSPPEGLFTKGPEAIATQLKKDSKDLKQAMSRLIFYINRAGDNLTQERIDVLEKAKDKLRGLYEKNAEVDKEAIGRPPKGWWDKMVNQVKKNQPSYSKDIVERTVGDIWHNKLDDNKKRQLVRKYER
jgi:hypothetical protein